ncbi:thermonuclease family protein [Qipengyuania gaetbuli]|nr:thermonuclease family protein [Qipengyuania gaetbuli]
MNFAMRWLLLFAALQFPSAASAQVFTGTAIAVDGDSLEMTGARIRLHGIDAPEGTQACQRNGEAWACGAEAKAMLAGLVDGKLVTCEQRDIDVYGRLVATCKAGRVDPAQALVRSGMAIALSEFSDAYLASEASAKQAKVGLWSSEFQLPADFRAANPQSAPQVYKRPTAPGVRYDQATGGGLYFRSCREARAAGRAPIYRGQPGYRSGLDGDNDGIACEPYRGR